MMMSGYFGRNEAGFVFGLIAFKCVWAKDSPSGCIGNTSQSFPTDSTTCFAQGICRSDPHQGERDSISGKRWRSLKYNGAAVSGSAKHKEMLGQMAGGFTRQGPSDA